MANLLLPIQAGTLLQGECPTTLQEILNLFAANMNAVLANGRSFYNYGDTKPAPEFNAYPWLYTGDMEWYQFSGVWRRPHEFAPGRHLWEEFAQESDIWKFDGGDGSDPSTSPPTAVSGAMWALDKAYAGRSPMSPGDISGTTPVKTLGYGEDYGVGEQVLTSAQMAAHYHGVGTDGQPGGGDPPVMLSRGWSVPTAITGRYEDMSGTQTWADGPAISSGTMGSTDALASATATPDRLSIVHPVRGMCCIVRTARIYRTIP